MGALSSRHFSRSAACLVTVVAAAAVSAAHAEPYLAVRTGLGCASCHLNKTGGGGRTAYGAGYGAQTLPWTKLAPGHGLFEGAIGDRVRLGLDGRGGYVATFRDEGPYIGAAEIAELKLYLAVELLKERLSVYLDESVAPGGATAREAFLLYSFHTAGMYLKGGKFFPSFGLRFQDDEAATRRGTGFTFETSDIGAEFGMDDGRWTTALAITNGNSGGAEQDNGKQYSWTGAHLWSKGRFGLSASVNDLPAGARRTLAGVFGAFRLGRVAVLAEIDSLHEDDGVAPEREGRAGQLELDVDAHAGLTVRAFGGSYDLDVDGGPGSISNWGAGVDWTPLPGLQIRGFYRVGGGPSSVPGSGDDQAVIEAHVYF
jgi:hypothetical protein